MGHTLGGGSDSGTGTDSGLASRVADGTVLG